MELYVNKDTEDHLKITINNTVYIVETKFRQRDKNYSFSVTSIENCEDKHDLNSTIRMSCESIGNIVLNIKFNEVKRHHKSVDECVVANYSLSFKPRSNIEGIIDYAFGISPLDVPYFMIPGHMYNTNNIKNSKSSQPQLNYRGDINYPKTSVFYTRADRSTHNSVICLNGNQVLGIRINEFTNEHCEIKNSHNKDLEYLYNGLGINTLHNDELDRISVTMGYHHFPVHYFGKLGPESSSSEGDELHMIHFAKDVEYTTKGNLFMAGIKDEFAYEDVIEYFYDEIHEHPGNVVDRMGAVSDLVRALKDDAYSRQYHYFPTVLSGVNIDTGAAGDTAWTGGMQVIYPMIRASKFVPDALEIPFDFIENLIKTGYNKKAGFFYESKTKDKWTVSGWWKNHLTLFDENFNKISEAHSAYVNGQATCYLLKSYQFINENRKNIDMQYQSKNIDQWLIISKAIINHVIDTMRYDGALGVYFNPTNGKPVYFNSFQGTWFLAGIAELYKITHNKKYKEAFYKAFGFYKGFVENLEMWGMPMDTSEAVDEEGNLAFITALKTMHEVTHDKELLETLIHCFHYEFSWKFPYNTVHVNEPLKSLNWSSSGGSITSSHNIHIHQMGNLVCEEMFYVYEKTKNPYILSRLKDTLNWGLGTHNSEYYDFGFGTRGWATEQFYHTDGKQDDVTRAVDGGIWYDYLSWAAGCCLLSSSLDLDESLYKI